MQMISSSFERVLVDYSIHQPYPVEIKVCAGTETAEDRTTFIAVKGSSKDTLS